MPGFILPLIGMIPGLMNLINGFQTAYFDAKVRIFMAKTGADKETVVEILRTAAQNDHETTSRLAVIASNKILSLILVALILPYIIWAWSAIVFDIVWLKGACGEGFPVRCTDAIRGQLADWGNSVVYSVTGSATTLGVAKMWFSRQQK